jgi:serine/threonine protein kinase
MGALSLTETIQALGKYVLIEKLGEGYLGTVFRGLDQELGQAVAVRILCDGIKWDENVEDLFHRQCKAIAALKHPNIAALMDVDIEGQSRYVVMESLGNRSLHNLIAQKSVLSYEAKLSIMIQIADGLGYAHKNGILHLDLNPEKIHFSADGRVKIRDFSIAHVLIKHLPHPPVRWGAPIYLSPEQIQHKSCDERSDIFSAGTIFYELLTGLHPFHDPNGNVALDNILLDGHIPTFERFPDAPPEIWRMLKTCLARDPQDRYQSMEDLAVACRELMISVTEDTQLMLVELYAAMTPLRRAAAQPNASEDIKRLLEDIQKLSSGEKEAEYTSLNEMMAILINQDAYIRSSAEPANPINLQIPLAGEKTASFRQSAPPSSEPKAQAESKLQEMPADMPPAKQVESTEMEDKTECLQAACTREDNQPQEPPKPLAISSVAQSAEKTAATEQNDPEAPPEKKVSTPTQYRRIRRPSYRIAAVLLSILVMAVAAYIVWGR